MAYRRRSARKSYRRGASGYSRGRGAVGRRRGGRGSAQRQQVVKLVIQQAPTAGPGIPGLVGVSQHPSMDGRRTF